VARQREDATTQSQDRPDLDSVLDQLPDTSELPELTWMEGPVLLLGEAVDRSIEVVVGHVPHGGEGV
jgi:hypothetical protein